MGWYLVGVVVLVPWLIGVGWLAAVAWTAGRDLVERQRAGDDGEPAERSPLLSALRPSALTAERRRGGGKETPAQARFRRWQQGLGDDS